ncbi:hypothetical protein U27_04773 [Candidatus Vecturithrix granuli]|uniref:Peptidase S55 domain-containing protein n=1 Tax=Vecturithrix granuli TaxID=1499967 RepID=A0A081BZQ1_VECG1|nr:hypothetical protein U27_04773 [Candidatus Vecturithrix granuli]
MKTMMKIVALIIVSSLIMLLNGLPACCADIPALMAVDDIRPGMKGIGKTVFSGVTIEEFEVEILGVLKNQTPHGDAIMAKVSGGPLPLEQSGVLAGMSGSPIYIDGKLIGALAYAYAFAKEPMIAGITPIHEMLRDAERGMAASEVRQIDSLWPSGKTQPTLASLQLRPIQTPLIVSGGDARVLTFMEQELSDFYLTPLQGGGAAQTAAQFSDPDLEPGAAVAIQLVRGDMDISAVGTVTYRDNQTILAFGHPMFLAGQVNLPMTSAYVDLIVSNLINSFKMASPLKTVGTITQDWYTGIAGVIGQTPRMVPLEVTVQSGGEPVHATHYEFEVIDHTQFTSLFMKIASLNALLATEKMIGDATIHTRTTIALKEAEPLVLENQTTGQANLIPAILQSFAPLDALINNQFEPVAVERVAVEISVNNSIQWAELFGVRVSNNMVRPGETLDVTMILRPYNRELTTITQPITIPENVRQEVLQLIVCDANMTTAFENTRAQARFQPQNLAQFKELLKEQPGQNTIMMSLLQLQLGAVVQGKELPSPPISMMTLLTSTERYTGKNNLTRGRILARVAVPTQYVITGCTALELTVDHSAAEHNIYDIKEQESIGEEGEITP